MQAYDLYRDISQRTQGDVYIGVVGPVRTGKSTFIKQFMDKLVLPNMTGEYMRERANDELPQSAAGKTVMTTEPKFIPDEAVQISVGECGHVNVRMIDCVGYMVPEAMGDTENGEVRMVHTPWSEEAVPFEKAAETGTRKVIAEHSTIGVLVTTDGSFGDIPRENYLEAEARIAKELTEIGKPFVVDSHWDIGALCFFDSAGDDRSEQIQLPRKRKRWRLSWRKNTPLPSRSLTVRRSTGRISHTFFVWC